MSGEARIVPGEAIEGLEFVMWLTFSDIDIPTRLADLEKEMEIIKGRIRKASSQKQKNKAKLKGSRCETGDKRLRASENRIKSLKDKLTALQQEYAALLGAQMGVPLNFVLNSCGYRKNGSQHILLGLLDDGIGDEHHGHFAFDSKGRCTYARLPFEAHGRKNALEPPAADPIEMKQRIFSE